MRNDLVETGTTPEVPASISDAITPGLRFIWGSVAIGKIAFHRAILGDWVVYLPEDGTGARDVYSESQIRDLFERGIWIAVDPPVPTKEEVEVPPSSVETLATPDLEKLLSDALSGEGNDSIWEYEIGTQRYRGSFGPRQGTESGWELKVISGPWSNPWDQPSFWIQTWEEGDLVLISPPSVRASEPSDVQLSAPTTVQKDDLSPSSLVVWEGEALMSATHSEDGYMLSFHGKANDFDSFNPVHVRITQPTDQPIPDATREGEAS